MKPELLGAKPAARSLVAQKAPCGSVSVRFVLEFRKPCSPVVLTAASCFEGESVAKRVLSSQAFTGCRSIRSVSPPVGRAGTRLRWSRSGAAHCSRGCAHLILCDSDGSPGG